MRRIALAAVLIALSSVAAANDPPRVIAPPGTSLGLPFSPGILSGDFLYLSGAIGNQPGTTTVAGDAAAQTRQTLANLETVLAAAGLDFSRVVDANVYLSDVRVAAEAGGVWIRTIGDRPPACTTVEADIAIPGSLAEISMIAARPEVEIRQIQPEGWPRPQRYSWGILAGETLFLAGMSGKDPATGKLAAGAGGQIAQAMENVGTVLETAGMGFANVVSCRVFLKDARDYGVLNEVYPTFFEGPAPARATVRANLVDPDWLAEIQCRAVAGDHRAVLPPGAEPRPILSPGIAVGDGAATDRLFLSGMVGRGPDGFPPDVSAQTQITLENLAATLKAAGMSFRDVLEATVFLTDIRHYGLMNEVYRELVGSPPPARATVGMQLMSPDALVEIQMNAAKSAP